VDERDAERGAEAGLKRKTPTLRIYIRFRQDIGDVNCSPIDDGTSCNEPTHERKRMVSNRT
jgi:hypothetical protein